jgi:serine/threonine protein kinase
LTPFSQFKKNTNIKFKISSFKIRLITVSEENYQLDDLRELCKNIHCYYKNKDVEILKKDPASTVVKVVCGDRKIVIRRDNFKNSIKFIKRILTKSRSKKLWEKGIRLKQYGFKTLEPLALIEDFFFFVKIRSYLLYEYLDGVTLDKYLSNPEIPYQKKEAISENLVKTIEQWHAMGLTHGDPKAGNVLVNGDDVYLIDLEDIKWPKNRRVLQRAIARDKCIVLHNFQRDSKLREFWARQFALSYPYGMSYFRK